MAVLKIENLPNDLYKKLKVRARRQHRSVEQEVACILSDVLEILEASKPLSILDLKGLGKEYWTCVDSGKHIAQERDSWD
jgi:plasmid stability protein